VRDLEKQIEKFKSSKRLSDAGQIEKLGLNAFRAMFATAVLVFF
jgi:hypothetical protein